MKFINCFSLTLGLGLFLFAILNPDLAWDSWAYHFPFSAKLLGFDNAQYVMDAGATERYKGFPVLAEYMQGLLWYLTTSVNSTSLLNFISLIGFVSVVTYFLDIKMGPTFLLLISFPLIGIHLVSSYIDLFLGVLLSIEFILGMAIYRSQLELTASGSKDYSKLHIQLALFFVFCFASGMTKFNGTIISVALISWMLFYVHLPRSKNLVQRRLVRYVLVLCIVGAGCKPLINIYELGNPFYPVQVDLLYKLFGVVGPEKEYQNYPAYLTWLGFLARPIYFILSITEIDWAIRGVNVLYNVDSVTGDAAKRFGSARTGGFNGIYVIILIGFQFIVFKKLSAIRSFSSWEKYYISSMAFWVVIASFMPQSHELRYSLYVPLCVIPFFLYFRERTVHEYSNNILFNCFVCIFSLIGFCLVSYQAFLRSPIRIILDDHGYYMAGLDVSLIEQARLTGALCLDSKYNPNQFKYSTVFNSGNYIIYQNDACKENK